MSLQGFGSRQILATYYASLEAYTRGGWEEALSWYNPTSQEKEEYKFLGMTPRMREWFGGRESKGLRAEGLEIKNRKFEATLRFDVDEIRRAANSKGGSAQINQRIAELAEDSANHWNELLSSLIVTPGTCYDGQAFYSASHSEGDSGTQKNLLVAGDVPALDVTATTAVTEAEMKNIIIGLIQHMFTFKDDQGRPLNVQAKNFILMVPPAMWGAAHAATSLDIILEGGQARQNLVRKIDGISVVPVVNPLLTTGTELYLFRSDGSRKPFVRQDELFETAFDDTRLFSDDAIYFGLKALRNVGPYYWQQAIKATVS